MIKWVVGSALNFISAICMIYNSYMSFEIMNRESTGKVARFFLRILAVLFATLSILLIVVSIFILVYVLRQ